MERAMTERDERLKAIRERYEASTPGEWSLTYGFKFKNVADLWAHEEGSTPYFDDDAEYLAEITIGDALPGGVDNAEFIAEAHQDVPWLLSEIERLEKMIGSLGASQPAGSTPSPPTARASQSITTGTDARTTWHDFDAARFFGLDPEFTDGMPATDFVNAGWKDAEEE